MEFENVNNFNLALEALNKKQKKWTFSKIVHRIKKLIKRTKPMCVQRPQTQEEYDNEQNEVMEGKVGAIPAPVSLYPDQDLKYFKYTTQYQTPQQQQCYLHPEQYHGWNC